MAKIPSKLIAFVSIMSALGNVLGALGIRLPSAPGTIVEFHLSAFPALLVAAVSGSIAGAITGLLSTIMATINIGNIFIPFGNAILAGIFGFFSSKFKFPPPVSGVIAMLPYTPYMWFACSVYGVPYHIIAFIVVKAFIEILISCTLIELILLRKEVKDFLANINERR